MAAREFIGKLHKKSEIWDKPGLQWSVSTKKKWASRIPYIDFILLFLLLVKLLYLCLCSLQKKEKNLLEDSTLLFLFHFSALLVTQRK